MGHNYYRTRGGECRVFDQSAALLANAGHNVETMVRDSADQGGGIAAKIRLALSGIRSREAVRSVLEIIDRFRPDVAHFHNVYPLLSPAVLAACKERSVPVLFTCHNYRLRCPVGTFYDGRADCFLCADRSPWWCLWKNCRSSWAESAAYAWRGARAGKKRVWDAVTLFLGPSKALTELLAGHGMDPARFRVLPNPVSVPREPGPAGKRDYAAFAGRPVREKGIFAVTGLAAALPDIPFRIAGMDKGEWPGVVPDNILLLGKLHHREMESFWNQARVAVVPSLWQEPFGLAAAEPQAMGVPVLASAVGGLVEIVAHERTGLLSPPGDMESMARNLKRLWADPALCASMGAAARERMRSLYSEDRYVRDLVALYQEARGMAREGRG